MLDANTGPYAVRVWPRSVLFFHPLLYQMSQIG